ncbi:MAG: IS1634 family transposase [Candidatus Omnitrophica bacterium]|nr:IS1634 family transposase [Candidatus Omnitrophota bacterium]
MFLRTKTKKQNGKTYTYYQLVEAYATPKGPRQRVVASLGDLSPRPREEWLQLIREVEASLSGQMDITVPEISEDAKTVAKRVREKKQQPSAPTSSDDLVAIHLDQVEVKESRELGPEYVGVSMWERLGLSRILENCGIPETARRRIELMTINALCEYESEHAMPDWARRTAIGELIGLDAHTLSDSALYRTLDVLLPHREAIEQALTKREETLFQLPDSIILYDLTSTYFEGDMKKNPAAKRGYSRDSRPDCKQVVMGLILDLEGFPRGHMIFDGNRSDCTTLEDMVAALDKRVGHRRATVVMDRGLATQKNLEWLRNDHRSYIVAAKQGEREEWREEFLAGEWEEVIRPDPPTQANKKRSRVEVKRETRGEETCVLCRSEGRQAKDAAIRGRFTERMERELEKLRKRVAAGRLKQVDKIHEAVGRLRERYPRVARHYAIRVIEENGPPRVEWEINEEAARQADELDGTYLLRTNRRDLSADVIWKIYIMLTHVESAFRHLKTTLNFRPVRHQLQNRGEAHLFLCVLAYHLLHGIESTLRAKGDFRSWSTIRKILRTHQVNSIVLPAENGDVYELRKPTAAEPEHCEIYQRLEIDPTVNRYPRSKRKYKA